MKTIKSSIIFIACTAAFSSFAQTPSPQCGATNFDPNRSVFTIINDNAGAVNQQCFVTVHPRDSASPQIANFPQSNLVAGNYLIELSGGGGGGAGGASKDKGGGGGGAGAAPSRSERYLAPGVYKLTIGTGGDGGSANGGATESGNPTSLTNADNGSLIAGFAGADVWKQRIQLAQGAGHGGAAKAGGSSGGDGGDSGPRRTESPAETGGQSQTPGYYGTPGRAGDENSQRGQANAGGGGGASVGSGGTGESANRNSVAGSGDLGGGGGGGRGGAQTADAGGRGGHGFIKLTLLNPVQVAVAKAAPVVPAVVYVPVTKTTVIEKRTISTDTLFVFGKSTLRPGAHAKLDDLVRNHSGANVDTITVVGHADRIGSTESNQTLSEARAESVKAYLVHAGVPANRVLASGLGETQPVTDEASCAGPKSPKVIACLQPDRRVDIVVNGSTARM